MLSRIHGDIDAAGAEWDFAVNVQPGMPTWLFDALSDALHRLASYPSDAEVREVTGMIATYHGVPNDHVVLLAGASEGFAMLPKLAPAHPAVVHPGFSEPDIVLTDAGCTVDRVVLPPPFTQLQGISEAADLVIIGNPTNPTGVLWDKADLLALRRPGRILVVDEAFIDLASEENSLAADTALGDIIVLRSLTKTWGLAGLRIGYMVAAPKLLRTLTAGRAHWPIGTLQLAAVRAIFNHQDQELPRLRLQVAQQREEMIDRLTESGYSIASPSQAPFILVTGGNEKRRQQLLAQKIAIRRCDTFPGLGLDYWRLAVRDRQTVDKLIAALT
ncbi:putative aminotransferase [Corynebacterium mustelae]|uniref:Aminotransferase n=2 Tax=Corynebacterium mustelae TaxID=571915 RepID=A0A0G3H1B0_9CORY|nr:putative aminotransferase [Corynebacterium mustelae]